MIEVFAKAGYDTVFVARTPDKVEGVLAAIGKSLDKQVTRAGSTRTARPPSSPG